jgi:hypothetical protein
MVPKFKLTLPSNGKEVTFRPFLVKEEKILLMALESGDNDSILQAIRDSLEACVEDIEVSKLPYFDIEYLFLNLRAKSVGEEMRFSYKHRDGINRNDVPCKVATEIVVNVDDVKVQIPEGHTSRFMLDDNYGIVLKYPTIDTISSVGRTGIEKNDITMMAMCIDFVFDSENVYPCESLAEAVAFIDNLNTVQFEKMTKFFETMPKLRHEVTYHCSGCGQQDTIKFEGASDFF